MDEKQPKGKRVKESTGIGILFVIGGGVLLLRQTGFLLPSYLFSWPMILVAFGVFVGIKNGFRDFSWLIFVVIGGFFLLDNVWPAFRLKQYMWPVIVVSVGLLMIFSPRAACSRRNRRMNRGRQLQNNESKGYFDGSDTAERGTEGTQAIAATPDNDTEDYVDTLETNLDIVSIFGGVKKKVLSKNFTGGEVVCVFGGAQINLSNADFKSPIILDLVQIFGGTKLVVPANWEIRSEVATIFGGLDDKRPQPMNAMPEKVVILQGTIIFGGVEVSSF